MKRFFLIAILAATSAGAAPAAKCRCQQGQDCWPTSSDIEALGKTLSRPEALLANVRPPASVCHGSEYDEARCTAANASWANPFWLSEQPGAMQEHLYEAVSPYANNDTLECDIATPKEQPCGQGEVPTIGVEAHEDIDIVKALDFAHRHNIRPVIKNTGHDFMGRSAGSDGFLVWTHRLKNATVETDFVPAGCTTKEPHVLRLGAGVQWNDAYNTVAAVNRTVVGGISGNGTVGSAGGWLAGAGHSILSPAHGLGVDNVLQFRVVLPPAGNRAYANRRIVTASSCSHPDLFWALRGGGGGTFGVVTEVVYRTHEDRPGLSAFGSVNTTDAAVFKRLTHAFLQTIGTNFVDDKWGGYGFITPLPTVNAISFYLYRTDVLPDSDAERTLNKTMTGLLDRLQRIAASPQPIGTVTRLPNFQALLAIFNGGVSGSGPSVQRRDDLHKRSDSGQSAPRTFETSRLLPRTFFENSSAVNEYLDAAEGTNILTHNVLGGAVSQHDADSAAAHPGWRKNVVHVLSIANEPVTSEKAKKTLDKVTDIVYGKDRAAKDVACYLNEAPYDDDYWPRSFFGSHWERLSRLKRAIDPLDQLIVYRGVGSERWSDDLKCLRSG